MLKIGLQFFGEPEVETPETTTTPETEPTEPAGPTTEDIAALEAKLKAAEAEAARRKIEADKNAKEAADYKKQLRASKSAEEQIAEEKEEENRKMRERLAELEKKSAVATISKKVLCFIEDEKVSDSVAECLYGAEDVDSAIDAINKAWEEKEKKLHLQYKNPGRPAAGEQEADKNKDVDEGHKFGKMKVASMQRSNEGLKKFMR